jgi:hypothetical protein
METISKNILTTKVSTKLIEPIFDSILDFYNKYNPAEKIEGYTPKVTKITSKLSSIMIIKEALYKLIRSKSDLKVEENNINNKKEIFYTTKINNDNKTLLFLSFCIFYLLDSNHSRTKSSVGFDFEFNRGEIALCQVGFFPKKKLKYIFMFNPKLIKSEHKKLLIDVLFTSNMYKIVHGADSLDIPYIFNELFDKNTEYIKKFTENTIDTRFLCEYFKIFTKSSDKKCSIYDALLYFKVISNQKYDELEKVNELMGPVQDVNWNVSKMSSFHLKYALYDVLYLKNFIDKIFDNAIKTDSALHQQLKYIPQIDRFIMFDKFGILDIITKTKEQTDHLNNYIITKSPLSKFTESSTSTKSTESTDSTESIKSTRSSMSISDNVTMISVYNNVIQSAIIPSIDMKISNLLEINNFKKPVNMLLKLIVYSIILEKYDVYVNKKEKCNEKLNFKIIINKLVDVNLNKFAVLLERFSVTATSIILDTY